MIKNINLFILTLSILVLGSCSDKSSDQPQIANTKEGSWEWEEEKSNQNKKIAPATIEKEEPTPIKDTNAVKQEEQKPIKYPVAINSKRTSITGNKVDININLTISLDIKDLKKGKSINITADAKQEDKPKKVQVAKVLEIKEPIKPERDITKTIPSIIKKEEEAPQKEKPVKMATMSKPKEMIKPVKIDKKSDSKSMNNMENMGGMEGMNMGGSTNPQMLNDTLKADGYVVNITSAKPLVVGDNNIEVTVMKDNTKVTDAKVKVKFFMPEMPGMPYMEYNDKLKLKGDRYKGLVNYSMGGTWQYNLKFKTSDDKIHRVRGSVNL